MWKLFRRWRGKPVTEPNGHQAQALHAEAASRLIVAQYREKVNEARGDTLADLARRAMGGKQ